MASPDQLLNAGYSPDISIELAIHGEKFDVASFGPSTVRIRSARLMSPGNGTIRLSVAGQVSLFQVEMLSGIDPARQEHPYVMLESREEATALAHSPGM